MGRSVDYLNRATAVIYCHIETQDEYAFDDFLDNIKEELLDKYPSLDSCERWDGRETKIFLENSLVEIGISEYCGLISISIRPNEYRDVNESLAENWIRKIEANLRKSCANYSQTLRKVGTFSNGEGIYEKA
jgi:hypothetical protein